MEALIGFFLMMAFWLSVLEMRLRRAKLKNRKNQVSIERNFEEIVKIKLQYGKKKERKFETGEGKKADQG